MSWRRPFFPLNKPTGIRKKTSVDARTKDVHTFTIRKADLAPRITFRSMPHEQQVSEHFFSPP